MTRTSRFWGSILVDGQPRTEVRDLTGEAADDALYHRTVPEFRWFRVSDLEHAGGEDCTGGVLCGPARRPADPVHRRQREQRAMDRPAGRGWAAVWGGEAMTVLDWSSEHLDFWGNNRPVCPHCNRKEEDTTDLSEGDGEITCGGCGKTYRVLVEVTWTYSTAPMEAT